MRKLLVPLVIILLTLITVACAVADPNDIPVENEELTIMLDISEEIKEKKITVNVALRIDDSFSINVPLTREESSKTYPAAITTYNVMVQESGFYDYEYPDTITIKAGGENTLIIKVFPKSAEKDEPEKPGEEDPVIPPSTTGILDIDFCNFFEATMHYEIYKYNDASSPIYQGETKGDLQISLLPGDYKIKCNLVNSAVDIKLCGLNNDLNQVSTDYPISFNIEIGKKTFLGYYIDETSNGKRNSRIAINPTIGKELLGKNNTYGHDVSIGYTIKYGTGLTQEVGNNIYKDTLVDLGYKFIPALYTFEINAKIDDIDVSDQYVIIYNWVWANAEDLQGETATKPIAIYRGQPIKFETDVILEENQFLGIGCEQLGRSVIEDEEGRYKIAYDEPFSLSINIYEKIGDDVTFVSTYFEKEVKTISEGCSSVLYIASNTQ